MSYFLFMGDIYYPKGGMDDYKGSFDTLDEAMKVGNELKYFSVTGNWGHIVRVNEGDYINSSSLVIVAKLKEVETEHVGIRGTKLLALEWEKV